MIVLVLALLAAALVGIGVFLVLQRSLTRIVTGIVLMGHGAVVLLLVSGGRAGEAPIVPTEGPAADPLPQALALTAIVISFGLSAFLLVLAYRSWLLRGTDEVEDDVEDRRIARLTRRRDRADAGRAQDADHGRADGEVRA